MTLAVTHFILLCFKDFIYLFTYLFTYLFILEREERKEEEWERNIDQLPLAHAPTGPGLQPKYVP